MNTQKEYFRAVDVQKSDSPHGQPMYIMLHILRKENETQDEYLSRARSFDVLTSVKASVDEYLKGYDGKEIFEGNCRTFDWYDFMAAVPDEICRRHGFEKIESCMRPVTAKADDLLADTEAFTEFWNEHNS